MPADIHRQSSAVIFERFRMRPEAFWIHGMRQVNVSRRREILIAISVANNAAFAIRAVICKKCAVQSSGHTES